MPQNAVLDVLVGGRLAGTLGRSEVEEDTFLFGYSDGCHQADAVSLTMPVVRDPYDSMGTVHPIFEMNLPEGALLEKLRNLFAKVVPDLDSLGLLEIVGQSQIGRLRYARAGAAPLDVPAQNLEELLAYEGTEDLFRDLLERYAVHSGVSGVQPKVLLRAGTGEPPRFTHRGATHIVKSFNPREYSELAANEFFCMQASRHAGIPTAGVQLSANRQILLVERFDLKSDGTYLGCEDFCVLSGLRAHGRYEGSYEGVADRIRQFVSTEQIAPAQEQFFAMVALSCTIDNGDAHLKNFAVLYEDATGEVRLAPAYDMIATTPYMPRDVMALMLEGSKQFPAREQLLALGRNSCLLSPARAAYILERVAAGVRQTITEMRRYMKRHPGFARAGEHLAATFKRGLARLEAR